MQQYIITLPLLYLSTTIGLSQVQQKVLAVAPVAQETALSCWAACTEMVVEYQNPQVDIDQCTLINTYARYQTYNDIFTDPPPYMPCDNWCLTEEVSNTGAGILFSQRSGLLNVNYLELLLAENNTLSASDILTESLSWNSVKAEINRCRPLILFINKPIAPNADTYDHVVVAIGYLDTGESKYLICQDPQINGTDCGSQQFMLAFDALQKAVTAPYSVYIAYLKISPKNQADCDLCSSLTDYETESPLANQLTNDKQTPGFLRIDTITKANLQNQLSRPELNAYPIYNDNDGIALLGLADTKNSLAYYLAKQPGSNVWETMIIKQLGDATEFSLQKQYKLPDDSMVEQSRVQLKRILYLGHTAQPFQQIAVENTTYFTPTFNYPGSNLQAGTLYPLHAVNKEIKQRYRAINKPLSFWQRPLTKSIIKITK